MPLLENLLLASAAFIVSASALPKLNVAAIGLEEGKCETPVGDCSPWGAELGCEFCCVDFAPPPDSLCHVDAGYSGSCGELGGRHFPLRGP